MQSLGGKQSVYGQLENSELTLAIHFGMERTAKERSVCFFLAVSLE